MTYFYMAETMILALQVQRLSRFAMNRVLSTETTIFLSFESVWVCPFVLRSRIITLTAGITC